jgi:hypothetical protein
MLTISGHKGNADKTTLRVHLTPFRIAIIQNTTNNMCQQGCGEKGTLVHRWWECILVKPLWEKIWRLLKNLNINLPYGPEIPLWGYTQKNATKITPEAPAHPCILQCYSQ